MAPALTTLKTRPEFTALNGGKRAVKPGFIVLARRRPTDKPLDEARGGAEAVRFGITVTKKIGNAVQRNRARRRLRAMAVARLPICGLPGWDYVLIARLDALRRPFAALEGDLESALEMLHKARGA